MKRCVALGLALILTVLVLSGCGETINGINRDFKRVGKGIRTIFFRGEK